MNNDKWGEERSRNKTLMIVEGKREKEEVFQLICDTFPEMRIDYSNIYIYGTNIYQLYRDIEKEYGEEWYEDEVDLPFIVSKKRGYLPVLDKRNFTNILLVFDYERHDPLFSEEKIMKMQNYFGESTENGKLFINYPMLESYQDFSAFPDREYRDKKVSVSLKTGSTYKNSVHSKFVTKITALPKKIEEALVSRYSIEEKEIRRKCIEQLLALSEEENLMQKIEDILFGKLSQGDLNTAKRQMYHLLMTAGYIQQHVSYYEFMRNIFKHIVIHNIYKANYIQNKQDSIENNELKKKYEVLELGQILNEQNSTSRNLENGYIWVLNTCLFIIPDYNFNLIMEKEIA